MGSPLVRLLLTSVTSKSQCQGHSDFKGLYLKGAELGQMLL